MRRTILAALVVTGLVGGHSAALAYGPYAHLHLARQVAASAGLDAQATRYFTAGALLADIDKSGRLVDTLKGHTLLVKVLQGCEQVGPIERPVTHAVTGELVKKFVASTDARVRAFGLGIRSHGLADQLEDAKVAARRGHANTGLEDLAFDVAYARKDLPGASAALDAVIASGMLESPELKGWLAAALPKLPADKIASQMKAYSCFVTNFVRNKAGLVAVATEVLLRAQYRLFCLKNLFTFGNSCPPAKMWKDLLGTNAAVLPELVAPLVVNVKQP